MIYLTLGSTTEGRATRYLPSRITQSGAVGRKLGSEGDRLVTSGHTEIQIYRLNKASLGKSHCSHCIP
jgi:hypothetical protein